VDDEDELLSVVVVEEEEEEELLVVVDETNELLSVEEVEELLLSDDEDEVLLSVEETEELVEILMLLVEETEEEDLEELEDETTVLNEDSCDFENGQAFKYAVAVETMAKKAQHELKRIIKYYLYSNQQILAEKASNEGQCDRKDSWNSTRKGQSSKQLYSSLVK
jgi:hypothetical protein